MNDERRKNPRLDHKMLLSYEQFDGSTDLKEAEGMARTLDFSLGGFDLELPHAVDSGDFIKATLNFDGVEVDIVAEVKRVTPTDDGTYDVGVKIIRAPKEYEQIAAYYFGPKPANTDA